MNNNCIHCNSTKHLSIDHSAYTRRKEKERQMKARGAALVLLDDDVVFAHLEADFIRMFEMGERGERPYLMKRHVRTVIMGAADSMALTNKKVSI